MHIGYLSAVFICGLAIYVCQVRAEEVEIAVVSSGYCSGGFLKKKGVDASKYKNKVIFDPKKIRTEPKKPTIPGCFRLIADNVTLTEHLRQLTGEFEMRIARDADPTKNTLQCKKKQPKCGCGEKDSCMYCDFCKNVKKLVPNAKVNGHTVEPMGTGPTGCDCDVTPGKYMIDVEICTPPGQEIADNVPSEVLDKVISGDDGKSEAQPFSLFTTVFLYDFRYNSLSDADGKEPAAKALKSRKAKGMVGCYIIAANVKVES